MSAGSPAGRLTVQPGQPVWAFREQMKSVEKQRNESKICFMVTTGLSLKKLRCKRGKEGEAINAEGGNDFSMRPVD